MYEPLGDPCPAVRSCALGVLTHLVLGGRLKAKGSVAKVARLMTDGDAGEGRGRRRGRAPKAGRLSLRQASWAASHGRPTRRAASPLHSLPPPPGIQARARLFFSQLAKTGTGSTKAASSAAAGASAANPVYNLLPDMLSALCREQVGARNAWEAAIDGARWRLWTALLSPGQL
jgi:hypothetical protein